jgi:hypothetical protein
VLTQYLNRTRRLLQNPPAPVSLYSTADLTDYINQARGQVAGEAQCVRTLGTLTLTIGQRNYDFSSINVGVSATSGRQGVIGIRSILFALGAGFQAVYPRAWEWFSQFNLNNPAPSSGVPKEWAQYAQGSAPVSAGQPQGGSFYIDPVPDFNYQLTLDCTCYPIPLVDDTTIEAVPYFWTDAVAFFAAYLALLSAQTNARTADAERMFNYYSTFMERAGVFVVPSQMPGNYQRSQDPTLPNKLGLQRGAG